MNRAAALGPVLLLGACVSACVGAPPAEIATPVPVLPQSYAYAPQDPGGEIAALLPTSDPAFDRLAAQAQLQLYRNVSDPAAVSRAEVIRAEGDARAAQERLDLARARFDAAQARASTAQTELGRATVRAPIAGQILTVNIRPGEFLSTQGGGANPFIEMGETRPLHVRIDIDEEQAPRLALGEPAIVSPRGASNQRVRASYVRAEPVVVPKRQLTNAAAERVDVRVLQVLYALPDSARDSFRVGQQVDAYVPARKSGR